MNQIVTEAKPATLVPETRRMEFLPGLFGRKLMLVGERTVYQFMSWLAPEDYTGGMWRFHEQGRQPLFLSPDTALLQNRCPTRDFPFPRQVQATRTISAVPRALKRFMRATRMWISAVWRSGSLAAMRSPKAFRHRILASARLRTWYPVHRFQNALP